MFLDCVSSNPFRAVDWMWRRAAGAVSGEQPQPARTRDTLRGYSYIKRAVSFQRAWYRAETTAQHWQLSATYPDIYWAHEIYVGDSINDQVRSALEAYLLTDLPFGDVASAFGVTPETVLAYEALFFNVREKLSHPEYITQVVFRAFHDLGASWAELALPMKRDLLWKFCGYFMGAEMVARLTRRFSTRANYSSSELTNAIDQETIDSFKLTSMLAAKALTVTDRNTMSVLRSFIEYAGIEGNSDSPKDAAGAYEQVLSEALASVGQRFQLVEEVHAGRVDRGPSPQDKVRGLAAEVNSTEAHLISTGGRLPYFEDLKNLKFTETR